MVLLAESNQVRWHAFGTVNGRPRGQGVATARKLLVFRSVATAAVQGGEIDGQREVVVVLRFLAVQSLMAVQTGDVGAAVVAALKLVDDRGCLFSVALRAATGGPHKLRDRLVSLASGSRMVD